MSAYDLRSLFPLHEREFGSPNGIWVCRLAEVSDLRPEVDRLSWYLVFERTRPEHGQPSIRKFELITTAEHLIQEGFPADLENRLENWVLSGEQDGRAEWLDY